MPLHPQPRNLLHSTCQPYRWQKRLAADKLADFLNLTLKSNLMRTAGTRARRNVGLVQRLFRSRRPCTEALVDLLCGLWVSATSVLADCDRPSLATRCSSCHMRSLSPQ